MADALRELEYLERYLAGEPAAVNAVKVIRAALVGALPTPPVADDSEDWRDDVQPGGWIAGVPA